MQYQSLFILGRQPAIGRAELESVLGAKHVSKVGVQAMASTLSPADIDFDRFGSSIRLAKVLGQFDTVKWPDLMRQLRQQFPQHLRDLPEGKLKLGLSCFDVAVDARALFRAGLELKKLCKAAGRSVRLVPNTEPALSSAQVLHNQLTGDVGMELLFVRDGTSTWLAQTVAVQDITAYAARDQGRPKRDARVGMLPPKLAQIIVNLAVGDANPDLGGVVLDPFCGTGVVLQEATLMGFDVYGTDLEPRMIEYTEQNLHWLHERPVRSTGTRKHTAAHNLAERHPHLETGDATTHHWSPAPQFISCETYLGRPLSSWPNTDTLHDIIGTCNLIIEKFLQNIQPQLTGGTRLCLAVPAWIDPTGRMYHLQLLDRLSDLGYNRSSFEHVRDDELVYFRPDQLVARELLVITRK